MSGHTPGPWSLVDDDGDLSIEVPSDNGLTFVLAERIGGEVFKDSSGKYRDYSRVEANARLIAAAPELLNALQTLADAADARGIPCDAARAALSRVSPPLTREQLAQGDEAGRRS